MQVLAATGPKTRVSSLWRATAHCMGAYLADGRICERIEGGTVSKEKGGRRIWVGAAWSGLFLLAAAAGTAYALLRTTTGNGTNPMPINLVVE